MQVERKMDDLEIIETDETNHDALAAYYAEGSNRDHDKPPVSPFNPLSNIVSVCDRLSCHFCSDRSMFVL